MATTRHSRSWLARSLDRRSSSRRANALPTLPNPTSARSARIRRRFLNRVEHLADALEASFEMRRIRAEADAQVPVHLEMIAGHDEHALFVAEPGDERRG